MGVLALSMGFLCLSSWVCFCFQPKQVLLPRTLDPELLRKIAILSFVVGSGSFFAAQFVGVNEDGAVRLGGLAGALRRISLCAPLAIIAGTAYTIVTSNGKRIISIYNAMPCCTEFAVGVLFSSKQALLEPFFYLVIAGIAYRFAWSRLHLVTGLLVAFLSLYVLFPFGQVARNYTRGANIHETYRKTIDFVGENFRKPRFLLEQYQEYIEGVENDEMGRYFEKPNGFLERMAMIKGADSLISATLKQGTSGWENIRPGLVELLPRAILPRRFVRVANELGHKAGVIDEDNEITCVSFGFAADAFNSFGWPGVAIISFAIGLLLILVTRLLVGPLRSDIWAVVFLGAYQHGIAEAHIGGVLQAVIYQTAWTVTAVWAIRLVAEVLVLLDRQRHQREPQTSFRPVRSSG
jgi:hypothetical protein